MGEGIVRLGQICADEWPLDSDGPVERESWALDYLRRHGTWPWPERRLRSERVAIVRRKIVEVLCLSDRPLSLAEIRKQLGGGDRGNRPDRNAPGCSFSGDCTTSWCWCWHVSNRNDMKLLEARGLVARASVDPLRWRFTDPDSDEAMNALFDQEMCERDSANQTTSPGGK